MRYCIHCGKEINNEAEFCPYCGEKIKNQRDTRNIASKGSDNPQTSIMLQVSQRKETLEKKDIAPPQKKTKKIVFFVFCVCVVVFFMTGLIYYVYSNTPQVKEKVALQKFVDAINDEKYEEAESLFSPSEGVSGSFQKFAAETLKGGILEKKDSGYWLKTDKESFQLSYNQEYNEVSSDDFYMSYKVKYTSYIKSQYNSFYVAEEDDDDDGMKLYTVKTYKAHEIECNFFVLMGNIDEALEWGFRMQVIAETDDDYNVCDIIRASQELDEEDPYDGAYLEDDGTIVIDKYYIADDFSENLARNFKSYFEEMVNAAWSGVEPDEFFPTKERVTIAESAPLRQEYDNFYNTQSSVYGRVDHTDFSLDTWTYPKEFSYSDGNYIIEETLNFVHYLNEQKVVEDSITQHVLFRPTDDSFKIYSNAIKEEDLQY